MVLLRLDLLALLAATSYSAAVLARSDALSRTSHDLSLLASNSLSGVLNGLQSESSSLAHLAPSEDSLTLRRLLHGCHGQTKKPMCFKNLPQCPRCRIPRGKDYGHCKKPKLKRIFDCKAVRGAGSGGPAPSPQPGNAPPPSPPTPPPPDYYDEYTSDRYVRATDYEYEAPPPEAASSSQRIPGTESGESGPESSVYARVETPEAFQEALERGVEHVVLAAHLDMTASPFAPDVDGIDALNKAVGRVKGSTASIAGNCSGSTPESFGLNEPMPPGACAILVEEDFLDIPLGTDTLLLDSLYVAVASPTGSGSSVLLLHVDGQLMISNSVFQGAGTKGRAIDVNTNNGGDPLLYVQGFTRDLAPGIRVTEGSTAMLDGVVFRDIELLEKTRGTIIRASAIAAYPNTTLALVGVIFENNIVEGRPARRQAVGVAPGSGGTRTYAEPRLRVWQWPDGPFKNSESRRKTTIYLRDEVALIAAAWQEAKEDLEAASESSDPGS